MARPVKPYTFVGTEREVVDPQRYERAMRVWTGYLVQHLADERARDRLKHSADKAG